MVSGVGFVARQFLSSFESLHARLAQEGIRSKLSVITMPALLRSSTEYATRVDRLCGAFGGLLYILHTSPCGARGYFDFSAWRNYNIQASRIVMSIANFDPLEDLMVLANDGIFAALHVQAHNVFHVWIPHSLSFIHQQSYADNRARWSWEYQAARYIQATARTFVGAISPWVGSEILRSLPLSSDKILAFANGFSAPNTLAETEPRFHKDVLENAGIPTCAELVVSYGRADEYKGWELTADVIRELTRCGMYGVIISAGFSGEDIERDVHRRIALKLGCSSRIQVITTFDETLPRALLKWKKTRLCLCLPTRDCHPIVPYEAALIGHDGLDVVTSDLPCFCYPVGARCGLSVKEVVKTSSALLNDPAEKREKRRHLERETIKQTMDIAANYCQGITAALSYKR